MEVLSSAITARQAAEHCGIKVKRNNMAVCPFHKDKNPSMKIDGRYYCFGCGEKDDAGDVSDVLRMDDVGRVVGKGTGEGNLALKWDSASAKIKIIYDSIKDVPQYPNGFFARKALIKSLLP